LLGDIAFAGRQFAEALTHYQRLPTALQADALTYLKRKIGSSSANGTFSLTP